METTDRYRAEAKSCLEQARGVTRGDKTAWLNLAEQWRELAKRSALEQDGAKRRSAQRQAARR